MNHIALTAAVGYRGHLINDEIPNETCVAYGTRPDETPYKLGTSPNCPNA